MQVNGAGADAEFTWANVAKELIGGRQLPINQDKDERWKDIFYNDYHQLYYYNCSKYRV